MQIELWCVCYAFRMTARILDGTKIRDEIFAELREEIAQLAAPGVRPGLAAVLVGENPASQLYVKSKIAACEQLGMASWLHTPPASVTTERMLGLVDDLNRDDHVDGILIQLPLPPQVDSKRVLEAVLPAKDVDGFHPVSMGMLVSNRPGLVACTPAGCMEILRRNGIGIEGANAVVLGRSDIVGKPMALLLLHANATVTVCHSKSRDLPEIIRRADILVAAIGRAGFVQADWIKPGATVIDVGTNRVTDAAEAKRLLANFPGALGKVCGQRKCAGRRRTSGRREVCRRANPGAGRRRSHDHHHADEQHGESSEAAPRSCLGEPRQVTAGRYSPLTHVALRSDRGNRQWQEHGGGDAGASTASPCSKRTKFRMR